MKNLTQSVIAALAIGMVAATTQAEGISHQIGGFATYQDTAEMAEWYGGGVKYVLMHEEVAPKLDCGFDIRASVLLFDMDYDDEETDLIGVTPIEVSLLARYALLEGSKVYAGAGAGYYFVDDDEDRNVEIDNGIGFHCILGYEQNITETISVFAEAKYLWLELDADFVHAGENEADLGGFGASFGVAFNL